MKKVNQLLLFKNKFQLMLFFAFWLCYLITNVVASQFFHNESFQLELIIQSLLYAIGGFTFSFIGYWAIKNIRTKLKSNLYFVLLSVLIVYLSSFLWAISHHLSWWLVAGDKELIIRFSVYPIKALLFSAIILASILLLILTEVKLLSELKAESVNKNSIDVSNVQELFEVQEPDYEETILMPVRNKILNLKIDSKRISLCLKN
jgi:hypothetical protein